MNDQIKKALASYGRSVLAGASALYMAGVTDPKDLAYSLLAAIIPVLLRAANPNDPAFGKLPAVSEIETAVKNAKVKKSPAKKAPAKKKSGGGGKPHQVL